MEKIVRISIQKLPEGCFLATSDEIQGLVAQGRTIWETMEIARDVAKKLLQAREKRMAITPHLQAVGKKLEMPLVLEY